MRRQDIENDMNSILVRIIEGLVGDRGVEPPQLTLLHADFFPSDLEVASVSTLQHEVISVTQQPVEIIVRVGVDRAMGFEFCHHGPTHNPIHDPNQLVHIF